MNNLSIRQLLVGLYSFTPVFEWKSRYLKQSGGTASARYCYSVWLRHLVVLFENGMKKMPNVVAELGPGDSIGIGIAALLSGCNHYNAFDIVEYSSQENNVKIFDLLTDMFRERENIPDDSEFPKMKPRLKSYAFPKDILSEDNIKNLLYKNRLRDIRSAILNYGHHGSVSIKYCVPWFHSHNIQDHSVDLIYSQAVLEHVEYLKDTYEAMHKWLKPNGFMSHQIDFKCHNTAHNWNGHWAYNDFVWALIKGKRPYLLNRETFSRHIKLHTSVGFKVITSTKVYGDNSHTSIKRKNLSRRFNNISDDDMITSSAHIVSIKR